MSHKWLPVWPGLMAPSAVMIAGAALVLRNGVQAFLGAPFSLLAIAVGTALSALFAAPSLVIASAAAFCFSELADFAVYTPMRKRFPAFSVVMAGLVGSVIDSAIFLSLAFGSIEFITGQVLGKFWMSLLAGMVIRCVCRLRGMSFNRCVAARHSRHRGRLTWMGLVGVSGWR